jgi:hypothetical protein
MLIVKIFYEQCGYADFNAMVSVFVPQINIVTCDSMSEKFRKALLAALFRIFSCWAYS